VQPAAAVFMIVPAGFLLYLVVWIALSPVDSIFVNTFIPTGATLANFADAVVEVRIFRYIGNTLLVAAPTAVFVPVVCFPAAMWLARARPGRSRSALTAIQVVSVTGGMHALVPLYIVFRRLHLIDTYVPLIIVAVAHTVPFAVFTMRAFLMEVPESLAEQAALEGVSRFRYTAKILLPLSRPVITTSMLLGFLNAWNGFLVPLLFLNDDTRYTISVKLYGLVGTIAQANPRWGVYTAASIVNMAIILVLFFAARKHLGETALAYASED
jgi:ABC-type glycerol-3-phosphate transport system permease component